MVLPIQRLSCSQCCLEYCSPQNHYHINFKRVAQDVRMQHNFVQSAHGRVTGHPANHIALKRFIDRYVKLIF
eukprot:3550667-Amphidinium_carterae.2